MKEYGVTNHQRIRAFDGKEIEDTRHGMIDGYEYFNRDKSCTKSELAITMSHLIAMKKASDDGYQVAMIMEDDCELTLVPYWHKNINQIVSELPEEAEIFLMCNRKYRSVKKIEIEKVTKPAEFTGVCYLITEKGMNKIKKFFRTEEKKVSIDLDLKNIVFDQGFMREFNVYTYNISLFLLENYSSMSTHNQQRQEIPDINFESVQILKNEPFLIS
jgi:GR25 family glycosyltransferase involved in LPS biosynthesis